VSSSCVCYCTIPFHTTSFCHPKSSRAVILSTARRTRYHSDHSIQHPHRKFQSLQSNLVSNHFKMLSSVASRSIVHNTCRIIRRDAVRRPQTIAHKSPPTRRSFSCPAKASSSIAFDTSKAKSTPDFSDPTSAHGSKSTFEIVRAIGVFQACRIPFLVNNAERLLNLSSRILGKKFTGTLMKHSFFKHFCAGENRLDMKPVIDKLQANNIGPILDYAAENEGNESDSSRDAFEGEILLIFILAFAL